MASTQPEMWLIKEEWKLNSLGLPCPKHPPLAPSPRTIVFYCFSKDLYLLVCFLRKTMHVCMRVFQKFPGKCCITAFQTVSKDLNCRLKLLYQLRMLNPRGAQMFLGMWSTKGGPGQDLGARVICLWSRVRLGVHIAAIRLIDQSMRLAHAISDAEGIRHR